MSDTQGTTTVSTVAVHSGKTRIVIALLQCRDWLELKVVEVTPCLTQLADNLEEARELQQAHIEVIEKVKSKKSPVSELADQAQNILETQNTSPKVYSAMTDSLTTVWQNVNSHLELRANILDLNVGYHAYAETFHKCCDRLEIMCDSELPVEIDEMKDRIENLKDLQKECLITLNQALHQGASLIEIMNTLCEQGTLDSRPQQIRLQAQLAKVQVEQWIETLHLRRQLLQEKTENCRTQLVQCLELARITIDLTVLKRLITERTESLLSSTDQLGDAHASSQLLLHEHKKTIPEAKDMQEHALKIVKATEEFALGGHFAGADAIKEAYNLLELAATYIHHIEQRETNLVAAVDFFNIAQSGLIKLDQLEVQLTTGDLGLSFSQLAQLHLNISRSLDEITQQPIEQGYKLLQEVPTAEGVKRMVERIENKKINLSVQCTAHKEENLKANQMYTSFIEKYNLLIAYTTSMEEYVRGVREMGENFSSAKEYLQTYKKNLNDLQTKGTEITALVSTIPGICETLDSTRGNEIKEIGDSLRMKWSTLMILLEKRVRYCTIYVKALDLGDKAIKELEAVESELKRNIDETSLKQSWISGQQLKVQFDNSASNFIKDSTQMAGEGSLDVEGAIQCLNAISSEIKDRVHGIEQAWEQWEANCQIKERDKQLWSSNMAATNKTVDWVSKLDGQLYPVLNSELYTARQLQNNVEEKLNTVLPEIKRAQQEIQLRIDTAEALITKVDLKATSEGIPTRLKELNTKLHSISADYQILLEKLLTFFTTLSQVENRIESLQRELQTTVVPHTLNDVLRQIREFDTTKHTITEMFNMCLIDSGHIVNKIRAQEGNSGESDVRTVERAVESLRYSWQKVCTDRESELNRYETQCKFYDDLEQINSSIEQLSKQLAQRKRRYGDNLSSSLAVSQAFSSFENTIQLAEERILNFIKSGEILNKDGAVERELNQLKLKWQLLRDQVNETRTLINLSLGFFTLVDEAEQWFRDGNIVLLTIAQKSTQVKSPEEAMILLKEIEMFLKPGEEAQNKRIDEITRLAEQLYGDWRSTSHINLVKSGSEDIIKSFNQACQDLKVKVEEMKNPPMDVMETDEVVNKSAAHIESWQEQTTSVTTTSTTTTHNINHKTNVTSADNYVGQEKMDQEYLSISAEDGKEQKSPSPPLKKKKYTAGIPYKENQDEIDEHLQLDYSDEGKPPYFTTSLEDATVEEGQRLTLKCNVEGIPTPEIVWEKDGLLIENNPDYQVKYNNGICTLTIEETFAEDSARFTCRANNSAGSSETTSLLTIKECEPEIELTPPVFITPLSTVTCEEGEQLELKCLVAGEPLPVVQWFHGEISLDNDPQLMITYNNGEAIVLKNKIGLDDEGEYKCLATNPIGSQISLAKVNVVKKKLESELPVFTLELTNIMARAGQKIKLECEVKTPASTLPALTIKWLKDDKEIPEHSRDIKTSREGGRCTLIIQEAFPKDAGTYTIIVSNSAGEIKSTSYVTVKGWLPQESSDTEELPHIDMEPIKPTVQLHLRDQSVFEGKKVRLDCVIVGTPEPEVIWYHNDQPVKESPEFQLTFQGDRCSLIILEALVEDAGRYKVVAINSAGEANSQCILNVQAVDKNRALTRETADNKLKSENEGEKAKEGAPKFTQLLSDLLVVSGDTVTLECTVTGQPSPTVSWALNNREVLQSDRTHMSQDADGKCTLKITNVLSEDKGVYSAKATNQQGECKCFSLLTVKTPVTLQQQTAQYQPEDKQTVPSFSQLFADVVVPEGGQTKFECIVTGKPTPKVKWLFNDEPVSGKHFLVSTSGNRQVLSLPNVTKALAGKITCQAENEAGRANCAAILTVAEPSVMSQLPSIDDLNLNESGVFEMKRAVFMQSSTSSHFSSTTSSSSGGAIEPVVNIQNKTSKSEFSSQKIGDKEPVQVESHKTSEYKNIGGMESKEESTMMKSSGLEKSTSGLVLGKRKKLAPKFITSLNGCIVDQGSEVTLLAIIEGHPTPDISWSRNGGVCPQESEITWDLGRSQLKIKNIKTQHGGRYSCTASNCMGSASSSADVVVKKSSFPPVLGRRLQARTATVGERVALEIEVTGIPSPIILWYKDGQQIKPTSTVYRVLSQGNCHSLIIDKVDHIHTGQYSAVATNTAGEAKSTADLLVIEPAESLQTTTTTSESFFKGIDRQLGGTGPTDVSFKTITTSYPVPGGKMFVEESFKSEKQVEMKVKQATTESMNDMFEIKSKTSAPTIQRVEFPSFVPPQAAETVQKKEDTTDSISAKSALDFFKSIIKDNEEEAKKTKADLVLASKPMQQQAFQKKINQEKYFDTCSTSAPPMPAPILEKKQWADDFNLDDIRLEPGPPPEMCFIPKTQVVRPKDEMATRLKKLEESHRTLQESEIPSGGVKIFPTTQQQQPIRTAPTPAVAAQPPVVEKKVTVPNLWEGMKEVVEEPAILQRVQAPGSSEHTIIKQTFEPTTSTTTNILPRPSSFKPFVETSSVEKIWTPPPPAKEESYLPSQSALYQTDCTSFKSVSSSTNVRKTFDSKTMSPTISSTITSGAGERAKSPLPSAEGLAMDRLWAHKHEESSLSNIWPPLGATQQQLSSNLESQSSSSNNMIKKESHIQSKVSHFQKTGSSSTAVQQQLPPPPVAVPVTQPIYYVAVANATHTTTNFTQQQISKKSDIFESSLEEKNVISERTIHPSEAKRIWDVPAVVSDVVKKDTSFRAQPLSLPPEPQQLQTSHADLNLEPGPPPEIGFAAPPSTKERKQSYVEMIEQDLDREPTRRLVGAVRTIPPPKKESSIERQKFVPFEKTEIKSSSKNSTTSVLEKRSNSFSEDFITMKTFPTTVTPVVESPPHQIRKPEPKYSTVPRPTKFTKQCTESDYESDLEGTKIKARWAPWESDTDEPYYRKVKLPEFGQQQQQQHYQQHQFKRSKSAQPEPSLPLDVPPLIKTSGEIAATSEKKQLQQQHTRQKVESQQELKSSTSTTTASSSSSCTMKKMEFTTTVTSSSATSSAAGSGQILQKPDSPPRPKPDSPKNKKREPLPPPDGYTADTDEPQRITSKQKISSQHATMEKSTTSCSSSSSSTFQQQCQFTKQETTGSIPKAQTVDCSSTPSQQPAAQPPAKPLEPFPFKPSASTRPLQITVPLPSSPAKFIKGEFRESDYESDYETKIPPVWSPSPMLSEMSFRPVHPHLQPAAASASSNTIQQQAREPTPPSQFDKGPIRPTPQSAFGPAVNAVETSNTMNFAESTSSSRRVVSMQQTTRVVSFDQKKLPVSTVRQISLPTKFVPKGEAKWMSDSESESVSRSSVAEERRLQRVEEMRKRFDEKSSQSLIDLKPGEPPTFDYAPPTATLPTSASKVAGKHLSEMSSAFKTKAQQFVSDIVTDVKQDTKQQSLIKAPILKKRDDEPEIYREETKLAEHGTKHIDPDTGLIYFKYDFGYEFGLVLPGENVNKSGKSGAIKRTQIGPIEKESTKKFGDDGSIEVPVIHETTTTSSSSLTTAAVAATNGGGASRKKRQQIIKNVTWDPTSESEMSDCGTTGGGGDERRRKAKNIVAAIGNATLPPRITIPPASPSPASVSPSLSPYTPATHETAGVGQWMSETSSPMPLTSPIVVNAMLHSEQSKRPPIFITPLRDIAVISGQTARFECIVQAEPFPNILWAKDGRLIEESINHEIQFRNGVCRLTIPQAYSYDAGTYTCTATNSLGTQTTTAALQVPGEGRTYISNQNIKNK